MQRASTLLASFCLFLVHLPEITSKMDCAASATVAASDVGASSYIVRLLPLQVVSDPAEADFQLAHGTECMGRGNGGDPEPTSLPEMRSIIQACADRGRCPLIVANPDVVTVSGTKLNRDAW